jgi:hypothetical protein
LIVGDKIIEIAIKAIAKQFKLTKILDYVEKPNENNKSIDRLFKISQALEQRIGDLETYSHPKRDFVICDECKCKIKEK